MTVLKLTDGRTVRVTMDLWKVEEILNNRSQTGVLHFDDERTGDRRYIVKEHIVEFGLQGIS